MTRTSIIVSNLSRNDFLPNEGRLLSLANQIKLSILNLDSEQAGDFVYNIVHWSDLPFLSRIVIIFKTPAAASHAYEFLQSAYKGVGLLKLPESVKLSLQENLLLRSSLSDALNETKELNVTSSLENFRNFHNSGKTSADEDYQEPEPQSFDAYADLQRLGIDVSEFNTEAQLEELRESSPKEPKSIQIGRTKSLTKTLFRPELHVNTTTTQKGTPPKSPTITLDETF
ncbi:CIC11C00000002571 [Sungouiella intermedia]|uniref:CIC11C00000002571 n=1 Tax=Sungouiella intermedia TaxID=45354 RepID=A0A1L0BYW4_9ASCO|nr:CIC11C00000002571 [[Candida] intermedia]